MKPRTVGKEDPAFYEALGRAIKVARTQLDLERKDLAERANVSYAYLSDIETGRGRPGSRSLLAIAEALGRSAAELLQEAERYRGQVPGEPPPASSDVALAPPTPAPARSWFHEQAFASMADVEPRPAGRELRQAWRERLTTEDASRRSELHELVERLPREDVGTVLALVRRLAGADPSGS
jgi:transcriptional regulator with XRE-family HTH domain